MASKKGIKNGEINQTGEKSNLPAILSIVGI